MTEEKRLAAVVEAIDREAVVVPRGALYKNGYQKITTNPSFNGMSTWNTSFHSLKQRA